MNFAELTLANTTSAEVLARWPEAEILTEVQSGQPGAVDVMLHDVSDAEARRLAEEAGFTVA